MQDLNLNFLTMWDIIFVKSRNRFGLEFSLDVGLDFSLDVGPYFGLDIGPDFGSDLDPHLGQTGIQLGICPKIQH